VTRVTAWRLAAGLVLCGVLHDVLVAQVPALCPSGADRAALRLRPPHDRSRVPGQQQADRDKRSRRVCC